MSKLDAELMKKAKKEVAAKRAAEASKESEEISGQLDDKTKRLLECAQEAGASVWLAALYISCPTPIHAHVIFRCRGSF